MIGQVLCYEADVQFNLDGQEPQSDVSVPRAFSFEAEEDMGVLGQR